MKRILSLLLCFAIICTFCVPIASAADYDHTKYKLTGNQAADIAGVALTQAGYRETEDNITKYNNNGQAWCGFFVLWCAKIAKIPSNIIPDTGSVASLMSFFKNNGTWRTKVGTTPKVGDIIFFNWEMNANTNLNTIYAHHVGICTKVDADGTIHVADGNYSDKVNDRTTSTRDIIGYGSPKYTGGNIQIPIEKPPVEPPILTVDVDKYYMVTTDGTPLNIRSGHSASDAVVGSMPNGTVFHVSKTAQNGSVTWGYVDNQYVSGWCALSYAYLIHDNKATPCKINTTHLFLGVSEMFSVSADIPDSISHSSYWYSCNENVATVDQYGSITAVSGGIAEIVLSTPIGDFSCFVTVKDDEIEYPLGDLNYDEEVNLADIVQLRGLILAGNAVSDLHKAVADVNGDTQLNLADIVTVRNIIMGIDI